MSMCFSPRFCPPLPPSRQARCHTQNKVDEYFQIVNTKYNCKHTFQRVYGFDLTANRSSEGEWERGGTKGEGGGGGGGDGE